MSNFSENLQLFPHGSITMLFSFPMSAVILMDYDEKQTRSLLGLGRFSVYLVMQALSPILATVCAVDSFQWPLTKDTVVIQMAKRTFVIALPGLLYGLQFPQSCDDALIDSLERVFLKFGHYKDINYKGVAAGYPVVDNEPQMWMKVRPRVEPVAHEILRRLGQAPGRSRFWVSNENSCSLRASRMSATTKLIVDSVVSSSGTLTSAHISIAGGTDKPEEVAYASVSVFSSLVDAVEAAWVVSRDLAHVPEEDPPLPLGGGGYPNFGFRVWRLNEKGLVAFMHRLGMGPAVEREGHVMKDKNRRWNAKDREKGQASTSTYSAAAARDKGKHIK